MVHHRAVSGVAYRACCEPVETNESFTGYLTYINVDLDFDSSMQSLFGKWFVAIF